MFELVKTVFRKIDRLLPAVLLAMLLSLQGIVASGAADYITFPELIAPDGSLLSFDDICNNSGETGSHVHDCSNCISECYGFTGGSSLCGESAPNPSLQSLKKNTKITEQTNIYTARPEVLGIRRRAPPTL